MPSLHHLLEAIRGHCGEGGCEIPDQVWLSVTIEVRREFARQRIYVPPPDSRKDPARTAALRQAVRRLPTGVAASQHGVSMDWARKIAKKHDNRDT